MSALTLASQSTIRAAILSGAGVEFDIVSPDVDEARVKGDLLAKGGTPRLVAETLAAMKALDVSTRRPGLVIGADQTLDLDGALYDKARDLDEARLRLTELKGRAHVLHSAAAAARGGVIVWHHAAAARLKMRDFSDTFLDSYLARVGETVLGSVGGYQLEGEGVQLFDEIVGDYFSILGLPLLALLDMLRREGALAR